MQNYKKQICKGKLIEPSQAGGDLFDAVVGNSTDVVLNMLFLGWEKKEFKWVVTMVLKLCEIKICRKSPQIMDYKSSLL